MIIYRLAVGLRLESCFVCVDLSIQNFTNPLQWFTQWRDKLNTYYTTNLLSPFFQWSSDCVGKQKILKYEYNIIVGALLVTMFLYIRREKWKYDLIFYSIFLNLRFKLSTISKF